MTEPRPPRWRTPDELAREVNRVTTHTEQMTTELLLQVVAIEECLAAPWWHRPALWRRLRRDLRASVRHIAGGDFTAKRINTIGAGWMTRPGR